LGAQLFHTDRQHDAANCSILHFCERAYKCEVHVMLLHGMRRKAYICFTVWPVTCFDVDRPGADLLQALFDSPDSRNSQSELPQCSRCVCTGRLLLAHVTWGISIQVTDHVANTA